MRNSRVVIIVLVVIVLAAILLIFSVAMPALAPSQATVAAGNTPQVSASEISRKDTIYRLEEAINQDDGATISELYASDYIGHIPENPLFDTSIDAKVMTELLSLLRAAVPNLHVESDFVIEEGNLVGERVLISGDFEGEFYDLPPTDSHIDFAANVFHRFDDSGKIAEQWIEFDSQTVLQQFGAS